MVFCDLFDHFHSQLRTFPIYETKRNKSWVTDSLTSYIFNFIGRLKRITEKLLARSGPTGYFLVQGMCERNRRVS